MTALKKKTKEELVKDNALLERSLEESNENDRIRRANLSVFLDSPFKKRGQYDYSDSERVTYTWPEIYFHLGKLVSERNDLGFREQTSREINMLADEMGKLQKKVDEPTP